MIAPAPTERDLGVLRSLARRIDPSDPGAHNNLGVLYYERGLVPEAIAAFTRALELDRAMRVAQENLETVHRETGYYDGRIAELREQLVRRPGDRNPRLELGRAFLALGQHDRAVEQFEELLRSYPGDATALVQLGLAEQARGRQEAASQWFQRACEVDPRSSVARHYLGQALYNRGMLDAALTVLTEAAAINPDHADVQFLLGFVFGDLGHHEAARTAARRAIALNPSLGTAQTNLRISPKRPTPGSASPPAPTTNAPADPPVEVKPNPEAHLRLAVAFRRRGYLLDALREYRLGLDAGEAEAEALEGMAEIHLLRHETQSALELYQRLLLLQPGDPKLWNERGVVLHQAGRRNEAHDAYRHAIEAGPAYAPAWNNLAVLLAGDPDGEAAVEAFQAALVARPGFAATRLNLALFHFQRQRLQAAVEGYRAVLTDDPENPVAWNGIGLVLMELKRYANAKNAFARAVEADPESAAARYNLGFALSQLGAFDDALRETRRAMELDPYYVPQKYSLSIDLLFEESLLPIAPSLSADVSTAELAEPYTFDPSLLDQLFVELAPQERGAEPAPREDAYALVRDLIGKGLLEQATAEIHRVLGRGGATGAGIALLGEIFAKRGLHGEALERFRQAKREAPGDPGILLGEASALVALGRGAEAQAVADELVALGPEEAERLVIRARARLLVGDLYGAQDDVLGALTLAPGRPELLILRGTVARQLGDTDAALDAFEAALELDSGLVQAWYETGMVHEERQDLPAARRAYEHALAVLPTYLDAGLALGDLLRRLQLTAESVGLLVDLLLAEPYALEALVILGRSLAGEGRFEDAAQALGRVLRFHPEHTVARFHRGMVLAELRCYDEALEDWDRLVRIAPQGPLAAAARAQAKSVRELARILQPVEV